MSTLPKGDFQTSHASQNYAVVSALAEPREPLHFGEVFTLQNYLLGRKAKVNPNHLNALKKLNYFFFNLQLSLKNATIQALPVVG